MTLRARIDLIRRTMARGRRHFLFAGVGLVVGSATLAFFLALSAGVRERVLNRLYPVNQVELQAETVRMFGLGVAVPTRMDRATLSALARLPGVEAVFPKQRAKFQSRLWGGADVLGREARVESFFDGIESALIRDELRAAEARVLGPERGEATCAADADCGIGARCDAGRCARATWWDGFADHGAEAWCLDDDGCAPGTRCLAGTCRVPCAAGCPDGQSCDGDSCARTCAADGDCLAGEACAKGAGAGVCRRIRCRLADARDQLGDDPLRLRGRVVGPVGRDGHPCPEGTYCAARNLAEADGACEAPIPALVSPFLLEVYNSMVATALGLRRLGGLEVVLGVRFAILFGESYFVADGPVQERVVRRARVAGFSPKAMEFGVTVPLPYVVRANAAQRGRQAAAEFTSVVVQTARNEDVPGLVEDARVLGLTLAPRSEEGRKAANVLLILTLVFAAVSLVILGISAINITHTFLMLVTERRSEIAIYRSVGARLLDIRMLFLGEALLLGLAGGTAGVAAAWGLGHAVNTLAAAVLRGIPGSPENLFRFTPGVIAAGIGCAVTFALIGAWLPSRAAARTDPAVVLSQG